MAAFPRFRFLSLAPWFVGAAGIAVTLVAMRLLVVHNDGVIANAVEAAGSLLERDVVKRVGLYQYGLLGARGAITVLGENGVNRQVFARYVTSRNHAAEFPGAHGFGDHPPGAAIGRGRFRREGARRGDDRFHRAPVRAA